MATKKTAKVKKMDGLSSDVRQEKLDAIKKLVPEAFADGKIDIKRLQKLVGEDVVAEDERYRLEWSGKAEVFDEIAERSSCTLTLDEKRSSKDWKDSNNIFIEGENLEVLRTLQKAYSGKVKMIYIDPPYNTGKDFVYNDNFRETEEEYCDDECNVDENGFLKKAYKLNSRDSGRFHSNWLSMMYPRLYLARNLLREDGVIFVSIDDNEVHNLRMLMNEVFGEENFIAQVIWKKKRGKDNSAKFLSKSHEYLLVYAKSEIQASFLKLELDQETINAYRNPDNDPRGPFRLLGAWARGTQGGSKYEFTTKEGRIFSERLWLMSKDLIEKMDSENRLVFVGDKVYRKLYLNENSGSIPETIWDNTSNAANAADEIKSMFGFQVFDTVKPIPYIRRMIKLCTDNNSIVLDFFSGSGTTAHAVMAQNAEDDGNRQYICVQMPEETPSDSEASKAGYKKISDIAIERIKRASTKIKKDYPNFKGDLGVRVYRETESHFPQWHSQVFKSDKDLEQAMIDYNKAVPSGTVFDRATEVLLKLGYPLTTDVVEKDGYILAGDEVALVLDTKFPLKNLQKVLDVSPKTVIVLEKLFKKDEEKINFALRCKETGVIFQTM